MDMWHMVPGAIAISAGYILLSGIWYAASPILLSNIFGRLAVMKEMRTLDIWKLVLIYITLFFLLQIVQIVGSVAENNGVYEKAGLKLRIRFYEHTSRLPLIFYENSENLDKIEKAKQCIYNESIPNTWRNGMEIIGSIVSCIGLSITLASFHLLLFPLALISVLPILIASMQNTDELYQLQMRQVKEVRKRNDIWGLFGDPRVKKEIMVLGIGGYIKEKWTALNKKIVDPLHKTQKKHAVKILLLESFKTIVYMGCITVSVFLVLREKLEIGQLAACFVAFSGMQNLAERLFIHLGRFTGCIFYARSYYELMDHPLQKQNTAIDKQFFDRIILKDVSFTYPNAKTAALKNITLEIEKGSKIAIVGENGSGKSTLAKVITGLYPVEGEILFVQQENTGGMHENQLSVVSQEWMEYHTTLRDNVAISGLKRYWSDDAIREVLDDMELSELEVDLGGLDTQLGREFGGSDLSGGQWQRLSIARCLFRESELLLLDEPTSCLDPIAENNYLQKILDISLYKTAIIISHRLSLCPFVDQIVVMDQGKIVEKGSHKELMESKGKYYNLFLAQQQWYNKFPGKGTHLYAEKN